MRKASLLLILVGGCMGLPISAESTVWFPTPPLAQPKTRILDTMVLCLKESGFEPEQRDDALGGLTSKWRVMLRPQWREGRRERVEMKLEAAAGGRFVVRTRTVREINDSSRSPLIAAEADWVEGGGNDDVSERITLMLKMKLAGLNMND